MVDEYIPNLVVGNESLWHLLCASSNLFITYTSEAGMSLYERFELVSSRNYFEDAFFEWFRVVRAKNPKFHSRFRELRERLIDSAIVSLEPRWPDIRRDRILLVSVMEMDSLTQLSLHVLMWDVASDVVDEVIE
jgi:hypothetical protein